MTTKGQIREIEMKELLKKDEEEEEENEDDELIVKPKQLKSSQSAITIGDLQIISNSSIKNCSYVIKDLLKDKTIKNYLDFHKQKKFLAQIPMGIG